MLQTTIAGIPLKSCIYNASGPRTASVEALLKIGESSSGAILSKSATLVEQSGNPLPRFVNKLSLGGKYCDGSINSEGLPNLGIDYYISKDNLDQLKPSGKPYIVSISGLKLEDNMEMLERIYQKVKGFPGCISSIEVNVACPNIPNKPLCGYDFEQFEKTLQAISQKHKQHSNINIPIGLKLPPYFDFPHFEMISSMISKYSSCIKYIVCCNSIGNGLVIDSKNECEGMAAKHGLGGLAGGFIKHTALANVRIFNQLFHDKYHSDIDIIGVGGVCSGKDAFELILCGAKAIQIGTCHWTEGSSCFERISKELMEIMKSKGYHSIDDFRGKLKPYIRPATEAATNNDTRTRKGSATTEDEEDSIKKYEKLEEKINENVSDYFLNPVTLFLILIIAILLGKDLIMNAKPASV